MLLATTSLIACDKGDEAPKPIELTGGTNVSQTVYADETQKTDGIKFKATADWEATVSEITSRATDKDTWLKLSANKGGAGDVTLTIFLDQNDTGKDRKAEIRITCGGTTIIIIVEQKATNKPEDPDNPPSPQPVMRYVKKITSKREISITNYNSSEIIIEYDKEMRIAKITSQNTDHYDGFTNEDHRNLFFTYNNNVISIEAREISGDNIEHPVKETYEITLNPDGTAKQSVMYSEYRYSSDESEGTVTANVKPAMFSSITGRAASKNIKIIDDYTYVERYITKITCREEENGTTIRSNDYFVSWDQSNLLKIQTTLSGGYEMFDEFEYSNIVNQPCNWNLAPLSSGEWASAALNAVGELGLLGTKSKFLPSSLISNQNAETKLEFSYALDEKGYITKIEANRLYKPSPEDPSVPGVHKTTTTVEYVW